MRDIGERSEKSRNEGWAIISRGVKAAYFVRTASHAVCECDYVENFLRTFLAVYFQSSYFFAPINDQCIQ